MERLEAGKTYCQAQEVPALGSFRSKGYGKYTSPHPSRRSSACMSVTLVSYRGKGSTRARGSIVTRSCAPLPSRTVI